MTGHILPESTNACPTSPTTDRPGYVMVPREPTEAMLRAAQIVAVTMPPHPATNVLRTQWSAMLSAAPASPIPTFVNGAGQVLAYRYVRPNTLHPSKLDHVVVAPAHERWRNADGWTETPLYAALSPALDNTAVEGLREALEPVMHWYQSDEHEARPLLDIVADVVADLQEDRKAALAKRAFTDEQITALAERFCATPLPNSVYADACARLPGVSGRTGTNLLTVSEAEQMLRTILNAAGQAR